MDSEKLENQLIALAREHDLTVIEDIGFTGPRFTLMDKRDAAEYMALVYNWHPERLH